MSFFLRCGQHAQLTANVGHLRQGDHLPLDVAIHEERLRGSPVRHTPGHRSAAEASDRRVLQVSCQIPEPADAALALFSYTFYIRQAFRIVHYSGYIRFVWKYVTDSKK